MNRKIIYLELESLTNETVDEIDKSKSEHILLNLVINFVLSKTEYTGRLARVG
jgi:hypothetical protein